MGELEIQALIDSYDCREGCPTQDHTSYAECLKAARFGVAPGETSGGQYG